MEENKIKQEYVTLDISPAPTSGWDKFKRVVKNSVKLELFRGLGIVMNVWRKDPTHTVMYPMEKLPIGPRYRAVHKLLRLLESGNNRCIDCGLCEKICIAKCIRIDAGLDENGRKEVKEYGLNLGRCIFCGYCAEVCPELAIVHGGRYENSSEQRAHYVLKDDLLTPIDLLKSQEEFQGYGSVSSNADENIKQTPLGY